MNKLNLAIINEFKATKLINECEVYNIEDLEKINNDISTLWCDVKISDFNYTFEQWENEPFYDLVKNKVMEVLKNNNLSFNDNRCYSYLIDSVISFTNNLF